MRRNARIDKNHPEIVEALLASLMATLTACKAGLMRSPQIKASCRL
jgi:hypothetical protein